MRCPFCGHEDTQVKDSRPTDDGSAIRRRRFCTGCSQRFTTIERVQLRELTVIKSDGRRVPFDRDKLARSVRIALRHSDSELLLTVVDSGPGMPESFLPVAFDRFSRPDAARAAHDGGSGLGLAIVRAIVQAARGSVTLSNADGFTVTVSLPARRRGVVA